jgi:hypothetical protein
LVQKYPKPAIKSEAVVHCCSFLYNFPTYTTKEMLSLKKVVCLFVIFGLLAVSFAGTPGVETPEGNESPESTEPENETPEIEDNVERSFEFKFGSDQIEARIRLRSDGFESEVRHEVRAGDSGAEFRVEFQQESGDVENELRMRLRLFQLIEYIPDETPGYQNETVSNDLKSIINVYLLYWQIRRFF